MSSNPYETPEYVDATSVPYGSTARMKVRRIGVLSLGLFVGAGGVLMGLVGGFFFFLMGMFGQAFPPGQPGIPMPALGIAMLIFAPIFYGFFGFIVGCIYAVIYNVIASMTGGLELDVSY